MDNCHVSSTANGWVLKKAGAERAPKRSATKQELVSSTCGWPPCSTSVVSQGQRHESLPTRSHRPARAD